MKIIDNIVVTQIPTPILIELIDVLLASARAWLKRLATLSLKVVSDAFASSYSEFFLQQSLVYFQNQLFD